MKLDDLIKTKGEWLRGTGPLSDVVISSRIRLARNLAERPFLSTAGETEQTEIYRALTHEIASCSFGASSLLIDVGEADPIDRRLLVERHMISRQHAGGSGTRGVSITPTETLALMINEEDHLRIQAMRSGLQLEAAWAEVDQVDDALSERLPFAFDQQFGYLTACPTNVGTGIRVSVMVHIPALRLAKELERVERAARDLRLAVRGLYGEGTDAVGDLYQISNQTALGQSEEQIIETFGQSIIPRIVEYERAARQALVKEQPYLIDDKLWRAYGVLANARIISTDETHALLSHLRMGIHTGRFDLLDIDALNELFLHCQAAHLQRLQGKALDGHQRGVARAELLRKALGR